MENIKEIVNGQREFYNSGITKNIDCRVDQLRRVKQLLKDNEDKLYQAIYEDFGKSQFETYMTELSLLYHELNRYIKRVKKWSRVVKVSTGLANFPAKSFIVPEPLGVTLVIGAWNYPYQLSLLPAISSIAAGNCVIIKPSELASKSSAVMAEIFNNNLSSKFFRVVEGGVSKTQELLDEKFDKIFFTGSSRVGKIVYQAAAKNLTPVTLELGGKSPAFITADADLKMSAKRVIWAKFINAGQTCVAPDYLLVDKRIESAFKRELVKQLKCYPKVADEIDDNYLKIVNQKSTERLVKLIEKDKVFYGGNYSVEHHFIAPTILHNITFEDIVMDEEIFGPLLPVISYMNLDKAIAKVKQRPKPLACYVYSKSKRDIEKILKTISFGGGAVNDSLMHLSNNNLPFGGVGDSGMGSYHGKAGFDTFTHYKSILDKPTWFEAPVKYYPYFKWKRKLIRFMLE
ncbi:aldehyde dehydrogenase [Marinilabiliaceae bacterium ANBcel2]|nr:aldehyde dehydrogenase [Marinilabiliaceae bacterium ANBcel2]